MKFLIVFICLNDPNNGAGLRPHYIWDKYILRVELSFRV